MILDIFAERDAAVLRGEAATSLYPDDLVEHAGPRDELLGVWRVPQYNFMMPSTIIGFRTRIRSTDISIVALKTLYLKSLVECKFLSSKKLRRYTHDVHEMDHILDDRARCWRPRRDVSSPLPARHRILQNSSYEVVSPPMCSQHARCAE